MRSEIHFVRWRFPFYNSKVNFSEFTANYVIKNAPWSWNFRSESRRNHNDPPLIFNMAAFFINTEWKLCFSCHQEVILTVLCNVHLHVCYYAQNTPCCSIYVVNSHMMSFFTPTSEVDGAHRGYLDEQRVDKKIHTTVFSHENIKICSAKTHFECSIRLNVLTPALQGEQLNILAEDL